jgi:Family of unknown function (DUF6152)
MQKSLASLAAGIVLLVAAPVLAHHPFAAEFDWAKPMSVTGTITKVTWANPHAHLFIDARDQSGAVAKWDVELGAPGALNRYGLSQKVLKIGDEVKVDGWLSKNGSKLLSAKSVTPPDGRERFAASSFFDVAQVSRPVATTGTISKEHNSTGKEHK